MKIWSTVMNFLQNMAFYQIEQVQEIKNIGVTVDSYEL